MNQYIEDAIGYLAYAGGKLCRMACRLRQQKSTGAILVLRAEAIGDMVVTTPFLRELRRNYPKHHITLVCSPAVYNLVELCPYVDEILTYRKQFSRHKYITNLKQAFSFARKYLQQRNYEMAIVPAYASPDAYAEAWMAYFAGIRKRIGYAEQTDAYKHEYYRGSIDIYFTHLLYPHEIVHEAEASLNILRYLQCEVKDEALEVWTDAEDKKFAAELFHSLGVNEEKIKLALKMAMLGMSVLGIAEIVESKPSTVSNWISKAAQHSEKVNEVVLKDVETPKVEMDEAWTFVGKKHYPEKVNTKTKELGSG